MKCKFCGKEFTDSNSKCPYCGKANETVISVNYSNKVANFLAKPRAVGNFMLSNMNIFMVFAINLSIAALIVNLFTYKDNGFWFYYFFGGAAFLYFFLSGFYGEKATVLRTVRRMAYCSIATLSVSTIIAATQDNKEFALLLTQCVLPSIIIGLTALAVIFIFCGLASSASFGITCYINAVLSIALLIISLIGEIFTSTTLIYVSFGVSIFSLVNHVLLWVFSLSSKFKHRF